MQAGARTVRQPRTRFGGRQRSATPVVTYALIAINVMAFVVQMASGDLQKQLTLWPPAVADGQLYRLVTAAFLHYGATHLLLNMWALYVVGPPLEMWLGRLRFGALYALSGLGGSVLVYLLVAAQHRDGGRFGRNFRPFRCHIRRGKAAGLRRPLGCRSHRDQLGLHLRHSGVQFAADQLAGARGRAGHGRVGRRGLRLPAEGKPEPDPGRGDDRRPGGVCRADLVAHSRSPRGVRRHELVGRPRRTDADAKRYPRHRATSAISTWTWTTSNSCTR